MIGNCLIGQLGITRILCAIIISVDRFMLGEKSIRKSNSDASSVFHSATGHSTLSIAAPSSPCPWAISAVAVSPSRGIYALPNPEMVRFSLILSEMLNFLPSKW